MGNRYVNVSITNQTKAVSQAGFGMPLIFDPNNAAAYKEYSSLENLAVDFPSGEVYDIANAVFSQEPVVEKVAVYGVGDYVSGTDPASELSTALNTLVLDNDDWYFLLCTANSDEEIAELDSWANAQDKLYFAETTNTSLTGVVGDNTAIIVHPDADTDHPAAAWVGKGAPHDPGSLTWTFKTLSGIKNSSYSPSTVDTIHNANQNTYIKEGGVLITSGSKTASGDYIDIRRSTHFVKARMTENVYGLLVRQPKVPYSTSGIAQVVAKVEETLKAATNQGIIARDADGQPLFTVTTPDINDISDNDKANRLLPNVTWTATIAGAIEDVDIKGTFTL